MKQGSLPNPIIIGVDPGTVVSGYAIVGMGPDGLYLIDFGCIRPPPKLKLSDRYLVIYEAIESLLEKHRPGALAIETQFVHRNPKSALKLGMACGVVILAARKKGIPIFEYAPKKAKLAVTGQGNASKEQVQGMVQYLFKLTEKPTPADAADAIALAICHSHALQTSKVLGVEF